MSAFYDRAAATALRLIKSKGQRLPARKTTGGTFDPVVGAGSGATVTTGTFDAINLPASKGTIEAFDNRLFDGIAISKLRFFILAASSAPWEPEATQEVFLESKWWSILGVTPLNPAGTPVLYKIAAQVK